MRRAFRTAWPTIAVLLAYAFIASVPLAADPHTGLPELRSWTGFSSFFPGDATGAHWYATGNERHAVAVTLVREAGRSRWAASYLVHDGEGLRSERLDVVQGDYRLGKALVRTVGEELTVAVTVYSSGTPEAHRILFFALESLLTDGFDPAAATGAVDVAGFVREADWDIVETGGESWLVRASADRLVADVLERQEGRIVPSHRWELLRAQASVAVPAFVYDASRDRLIAGWKEFPSGREAVIRAGVITRPQPGAELVEVGAAPFGFAEPFGPGASPRAGFPGARVTYEGRRSIAVAHDGQSIMVAGSRITRQQSALSPYHVEPSVVVFDLEAAGDRTPRVVGVDGEIPGVIDSSFQFARSDGTPVVAFLREAPGSAVRSTYYAVLLDETADPRGPAVIIDSPRRIVSPHLDADAGGAIWLQHDPDRDMWQAAYQDASPSFLRAVGVPWHGSRAETVAAVVFAVPLALVLALYWSIIANAPLLALLAVVSLLLFRYAPALVRERYLGVLALVMGIAAALAGDPWLAWGGPHPAIALRALGFIAAYAGAVHHRRSTVHVPQTRDLLVWSWRALAVILAMPAYAETLLTLS